EDLIKIQQLVKESLDDDFNFEKALSYLHELKNIILNNLFANKIDYLRQAKWLFEDILEGDLGIKLLKNELDNELLELLEKRNSARKNKDWKQADLFRDEITKIGYKINDNPDGTSSLTKKI
ncbi:MAG: cysteine--tRNA ligase, partial [Endomicrobiaceae bacterium]|nr:cysteine--tRNA ligase [Endomicrobiaceae bacterium]